jgi:hypothetical protein
MIRKSARRFSLATNAKEVFARRSCSIRQLKRDDASTESIALWWGGSEVRIIAVAFLCGGLPSQSFTESMRSLESTRSLHVFAMAGFAGLSATCPFAKIRL